MFGKRCSSNRIDMFAQSLRSFTGYLANSLKCQLDKDVHFLAQASGLLPLLFSRTLNPAICICFTIPEQHPALTPRVIHHMSNSFVIINAEIKKGPGGTFMCIQDAHVGVSAMVTLLCVPIMSKKHVPFIKLMGYFTMFCHLLQYLASPFPLSHLQVVSMGLYVGEQAYLRSSWNILDGFLVFVSLIDIVVSMAGGAKILGVLRVLRLLRTLRPLRCGQSCCLVSLHDDLHKLKMWFFKKWLMSKAVQLQLINRCILLYILLIWKYFAVFPFHEWEKNVLFKRFKLENPFK